MMNESRPASPDTTDRVLRRSTPPITRLSHRVRLPRAKTRRRSRRERRMKDEFRFKPPGALSLGRSIGRPVGRRRRRRRSGARLETNRIDSTRLDSSATPVDRARRRRRLSRERQPSVVAFTIRSNLIGYNTAIYVYVISKPYTYTTHTVYKHSIKLSNINKYIINRSLHQSSIDSTLVFDDDGIDDVVTPRLTRSATGARTSRVSRVSLASRIASSIHRAVRTPIGLLLVRID